MDPNAIPGLLKALEHDDVYVRIVAAEALGKIGSPVAIRSLFETLDDDKWSVRRRAVQALGRIGGAKVVPGLQRALYDPEGAVRWAAEMALRRLDISSSRQVLERWQQEQAPDADCSPTPGGSG